MFNGAAIGAGMSISDDLNIMSFVTKTHSTEFDRCVRYVISSSIIP